MKSIISLTLLLAALSVSSCCKKKTAYQVSEINLKYIGYKTGALFTVYDIRTKKDNIEDIIDTVVLTEFSGPYASQSDAKIQLFLEEGKYDHILMVPDSSRMDTITSIKVLRDKCDKIETQEIYWNGKYTTETYFEITK